MPFIGAAIAGVVGAIGSAIGAAGAFIGGLGFLGQAVIGLGLNLGFRAISKALAPKSNVTAQSGVQTAMQFGADVPRSGVFGRALLQGHFVYWNTFGSSNKYIELVYVLGDGWNDALEDVEVNGELKGLTSVAVPDGNTEVARYQIDGYGAKAVVRFFDGRPGQEADAELIANSNPAGRITADDVATGLCYVSVTLEYDEVLFEGGIPEFRWLLRGLRLYDWRLDSTNGGTGSHRWDDTSTWAWSENPAVVRYNFQRGIFTGTERVLGQGVAIYDLLHELYTAAANVCDESVSLDAGGTEDRYRISLIVDEDAEYYTAIEACDHAMAGYGVERQGQFGVIAGAALSTIDTIADDDLVVGEPVEWSGKLSRNELVNALFGSYLNPEIGYQPDPYPGITSSANEAADGGERIARDLDLLMITSYTQAQRVANIRYAEQRYQATATITLGFNKVWYEAGDWIRWNSALYGDRLYRIVGLERTEEKRVVLDLRQVHASIYSWSTDDETAPITLPTTPAPGTRPTNISSFDVHADAITEGNRVIPALRFTWTAPDDPTIDAVIIEYRKVGTLAAIRKRDDSPEDGEFITADGVLGGVDYEARASIVTTPARQTTWTAWTPITTVVEQIDAGALSAELQAQMQQLDADAEASLAAAIEWLRGQVEILAQQSNGQYAVIEAMANRIIQSVGQRVGTSEARIVTLQEAVAEFDTAIAQVIQEIFATTENGTAYGTIRFIAMSAPSGVASRYAIEVRATTEDDFAFAGLYLDAGVTALGGGSRIALAADQLAFDDGSGGVKYPFQVVGGIVYVNQMKIQTANNVVQLDITGDRLIFVEP